MDKTSNKTLSQSFVIALLGLLLTALLHTQLAKLEQREVSALMHERSTALFNRIQNRMFLYQYGLRGLRGAYISIDGSFLTGEKFDQYTKSRDYSQEFPGALGFGFVRLVKPTQEAAFLHEMRAERPQYTIKQIAPHAGNKFVIERVYPLSTNSQALGLDIASEQSRYQGAIKSMQTGDIAITAPITLVQHNLQKSSGFLILLPYYATNNTPATLAERQQLLLGWVYAPLVIEQVLSGVEIKGSEEQVELLDVTDDAAPLSFFKSNTASWSQRTANKGVQKEVVLKPIGQYVQTATVFGRQWQLRYTAGEGLKKYTGVPSKGLTGILGVLISLLIGFVWYFWRSNHYKERLVIVGNAKLAAIVENSMDAIIGKDLNGVVISWNKGAENLFGYSEKEAVGHTLVELIVPPDLHHEERAILEAIARGTVFPPFETIRLNKRQEPIQVSVSVSPVRDNAGNIVSASKTVRNITLQKEAEQKIIQLNKELEQKVLARTAELQSALSENNVLIETIKSQFLYSVTNSHGDIVDVNQAFCDIHGYQQEALIGQNHRILSAGTTSKAQWTDIWAQLIDAGTWHGEICNKHKDGSYLWFDSVIVKLPAELPEQVRFLSIRIDISEKRQQNQQLLQLNALLQGVLNAASEISIIATDANGVIELFNTGAQRMLGYAEYEMVGVETPMKVHVEQEVIQRAKALSQEYGQEISGIRTFVHVPEIVGAETREWTYVRKDGSELPVLLSVTANRALDGEVLGYLGVAIDLTEDKHQKMQLLSVLDKMQMAAKVANLGIWEWDIVSARLEWNDEMMHLYQYPLSLKESGITYEHWRQRLHPDDEKVTVAKLARSMHDNEPFDGEFRIVWPTGEVRNLKMLSMVERDKLTGKPLKVVGINLDVTLAKNYERSLMQAKLNAEQANTAKSQFLANMSHEIRTPLNAVLGMLQLLQRTSLQQRQSEYVYKAKSSAQSLLEILNDVLDISKIEAGKLELEQAPFSLEVLLRELSDVGVAYQGSKHLELMYQLDPSLPEEFVGDQLRLKQVLINLMGNAIKFTDQGNVTLDIRLLKRVNNTAVMRFSVKDTGIGISETQLPKLFQNFSQAESATTRKYGGTGLGLAICNKILNLMHSKLQVKSQLGQGSTFWFDLSLPVESNGRLVETNVTHNRQLRLLVVDDNLVATEAISASLPAELFDLEIVHSSFDAIAKFEQCAEGVKPFDVVLMDLNLPGMNGLDAARWILDKSATGKAPVMIMISAYELSQFEQMHQGRSLSFHSFLAKPFTSRQVVDAIDVALSGEAYNAPALLPPEPGKQALTGVRILVVEDNALNRMVAQELLVAEGAVVTMAEGGQEAIGMILQATFDVVLMDVQMPEMDGYETTRRIRDFQPSVPIIALTANVTTEDRQACLEAGMNDHIGKPLRLQQMVAVINRHREGVHEGAGSSRESTHIVEPTVELIESLHKILARFNQQSSTYLKALRMFDAEGRQLMSEIHRRNSQGDGRALSAQFHAMKGAAATIGGLALAQAAAQHEKTLKPLIQAEGSLLTPEQLAGFEALFHQTIAALQLQGQEIVITVDSAPKDGKVPAAEIPRLLQRMEALLTSNNLAALELADEMLLLVGGTAIDQLKPIISAVQLLEFDRAITLIGILKASEGYE